MDKSAYSHLYNNSRWRKRRLRQLAYEPLCRYCAKAGRVTAASVADHIEPHKGDPVKFDGPIQSLCKPCHDSIKAREESGKGRLGCDASGFPNNVGHLWRTSANTGGMVESSANVGQNTDRALSLP